MGYNANIQAQLEHYATCDCLGFSPYPSEIRIAHNAMYGKNVGKMALNVTCTLCDHRMHIAGRCWRCMKASMSPAICAKSLLEDMKCDDELAEANIKNINDNYAAYGNAINE